MKLTKEYYNTILCQSFSPCGKYLYTGDTLGNISVFNLKKIIDPPDELDTQYRKPKWNFESKTCQVCSLISTPKFLISGGVGEINGWDWNNVSGESKSPKVSWTIQIPTSGDILEKTDVNVLHFDENSNYLYAGCGDNNIYLFSLEDGKLIRTLEGHSDFIHWINILGNQMASASEDGSVKLWDLRDKRFHNQIYPYKNDKLARPVLGKWIGTVALNDDWLICGGGPRLSLWHLRSLDVATVFPVTDNGIHVSYFYEDRVMVGGTAKCFYQFSYNGEIYAEIPSSSTTVYSAVIQENPKVLCIAGSSYKVDVCTNFNYRDQVLTLY